MPPRTPKLLKSPLSPSVMSNSLQPHGLYPARLLCLWDSQARDLRPSLWTPMSCIAGRFFTVWAIREANLYQTNVILCPDKKRHNFDSPRSQSWLSRGRAQLMAPSGPGPLTLPSCHLWRELGIQPKWPSGSSGHPKRGDQVPQTVTQADCHHHEVTEAGTGRG